MKTVNNKSIGSIPHRGSQEDCEKKAFERCVMFFGEPDVMVSPRIMTFTIERGDLLHPSDCTPRTVA